MRRARAVLLLGLSVSCSRASPPVGVNATSISTATATPTSTSTATSTSTSTATATATSTSASTSTATATPTSTPTSTSTSTSPAPAARVLPLDGARTTYYVPGAAPDRTRLVGHLHGICYPPSYSCGKWANAASQLGFLVCPTGNAQCGDAGHGPPSWEAPSWGELLAIMDRDLERAITSVAAKHPSLSRDDAILTGFSRGAFAAPTLAKMHPGRWPHLVLIEAAVPLSLAGLRKAKVRAVAFVAGEHGPEIAGERKIVAELAAQGFPVELFVMSKVSHFYSDDVDDVMRRALDYVIRAGSRPAPPGGP